MDGFWLLLLIKIAATASVVTVSSMVAERAGPFFGALIVSLPVSAGPTYIFLALQADNAFIAESAVNSLAANAATACFVVVLIQLISRRSLAVSLLSSLAIWLAIAMVLRLVAWTAFTATLLNVAAFGGGLYICRRLDITGQSKAGPRRWYELPLRAAMVSVLVAGVVTLSRYIGPAATGIATLFPVALTSLTLVVHPRLGPQAVVVAMASALRALPAFGVALVALHYLTLKAGAFAGLVAALIICLGWSGILMAWRMRANSSASNKDGGGLLLRRD